MPWADKDHLIYIARTKIPERVGAMARRREWVGQKRVKTKLNLVNNPVLRSVMEMFRYRIRVTGTAILCARQGMGKSVAGAAVLEAAEAGILFHPGGGRGGRPYWKSIAIALGMPSNMEFDDCNLWIDEFVDAVNSCEFHSENDHSVEATINLAATLCRKSAQSHLPSPISYDYMTVLHDADSDTHTLTLTRTTYSL